MSKIITLSGSTRFKELFIATHKAETLKGNICFVPAFYHGCGDKLSNEEQDKLFDLHLEKIMLSDGNKEATCRPRWRRFWDFNCRYI